jgi:hypothetical protein
VWVTILVEQVIVGGSRSRTTTAKLKPALLPEASVAVQLTVLVPFPKIEPLAGTQTKLTPGQLSFTVGANVTIVLH